MDLFLINYFIEKPISVLIKRIIALPTTAESQLKRLQCSLSFSSKRLILKPSKTPLAEGTVEDCKCLVNYWLFIPVLVP